MTALVNRTSKGLVDALFNSIDDLNAKKIDPEHARAIAHTAKTIVNVAHLEIEFRRFETDHQQGELQSLQIEASADGSDTTKPIG